MKPALRNTNIDQVADSEMETDTFSTKEKIGYGIATVVIVGLAIHFGMKQIAKSKENKSESQSFQDGASQTVAKQIKMAFENDSMPGTDTKKLRFILTKIKSKEEMKKVAAEYANQNSGRILYTDMKKELQSSEYDEMLQIIEGKPDKTGGKVSGEILYKTWAKRLKAAFDKMYGFVPGTDEESIKTVFQEIPTRRAFVNVAVAYHKEFKGDLMATLKTELESWEYPTYMMMITNKPQA